MIFYGNKSLYFRLRFWSFSLEVNFIRLYKIGSGHYRLSKIEIWKSKSKKLEKSENMGCVCSSKKLTAEQIQGMSSKIVFILNYILYSNYYLYIIYLDTTFWKHKKELAEKTKFTPDEIEHWYHGFIQDCPTGKLTKVEFANIYAQFFPQGDPTAFAS